MVRKNYKYYQPNKKDLKDMQGDCSVRALTKFLDCTWIEAFDELVKYARQTQTLVNSLDNIKLFMEKSGYEYKSIYKKRKTVIEFAKKHKSGTYTLYVRAGYGTHMVTVKNGFYYDTWDCGNKLIFGYWEKL